MKLYQPNEFSYRKQYLDLEKEMLFFISIFFNVLITLFCILLRVLEKVKNSISVCLCVSGVFWEVLKIMK